MSVIEQRRTDSHLLVWIVATEIIHLFDVVLLVTFGNAETNELRHKHFQGVCNFGERNRKQIEVNRTPGEGRV